MTDKEEEKEEEEEERKMEEKGATGGKEEFEDEDQEIEVDKLSIIMEEYNMYSRLERKRKREEKRETWREEKLHQNAEIETSIGVLSKNEENCGKGQWAPETPADLSSVRQTKTNLKDCFKRLLLFIVIMLIVHC